MSVKSVPVRRKDVYNRHLDKCQRRFSTHGLRDDIERGIAFFWNQKHRRDAWENLQMQRYNSQ